MQIGSISGFNPLKTLTQNETSSDLSGVPSFEETLKEAISEVNSKQVSAYQSMQEIAFGKVDNLQNAVMKIEEAELSLKLALEVKNKAIGAYKEIMRMQV